jgi:hypothetical protein
LHFLLLFFIYYFLFYPSSSYFPSSFASSSPPSLLPVHHFHSPSLSPHPLHLLSLFRISLSLLYRSSLTLSYPFLLILSPFVPSLQSASNFYLNIFPFQYYHPLASKTRSAQIVSLINTVIFLKIACIHLSIIFSSRLLPIPPPPPFLFCVFIPFLRRQVPPGFTRNIRKEGVKK